MDLSNENGCYKAAEPSGDLCPVCGDLFDRYGRCTCYRLRDAIDATGPVDLDEHLRLVASTIAWARRRPGTVAAEIARCR